MRLPLPSALPARRPAPRLRPKARAQQRQPANGATPATWQALQVGLRLSQAGTVQLSVETNGTTGPTVYFDDVSVEQTGSLLVQEQHPYAFGAPLPGLSYTIGDRRYRHGYQGQYADQDEETGFDSFELRLYNSRIGRWMAPDPYGQFNSPYVGMGNNPVSGTDPDGGYTGIFPNAFIRTGVFATAGFTIGAATAGITGGNAIQGGLIGAGVGIGASFSGNFSEIYKSTGLVGLNIGKQILLPEKMNFHYFSADKEFDAYHYMLNKQYEYKKEIFSYLVSDPKSGKRGVLVLPWFNNEIDSSDRFASNVNSYNKTIKDDKNKVYNILGAMHTHRITDKPSKADREIFRSFPVPSYILSSFGVFRFNTNPNSIRINPKPGEIFPTLLK